MPIVKAPTQSEAVLVDAIRDALQARGCYVVKHHGSAFGVAGTPDLLVCFRGVFAGFEVKRPGTKSSTTPAQRKRLAEIAAAGGIAAVVTSVAEALKHLHLEP